MRLFIAVLGLSLMAALCLAVDETTSSVPETTTASVRPTSTPEKSSTTPEKPSSTTEKPSSTTDPSTTTPEPSSTTKVAPTSTSVAPSTVAPPDMVGKWNITDPDHGGKTCILADMKVVFVFKNTSYDHVLSPMAKTDGSHCGNDSQVLSLSDDKYKLKFTFYHVNKDLYVGNISVSYPVEGHEAETHEDLNGRYFAVSEKQSYKCKSVENVKFQNVTLRFSDAQLQAYLTESKFGEARECLDDNATNQIIPIAVACVLVGMVVIILISYLVFRRQSRQRGYESV